jgi:hypothetical protein
MIKILALIMTIVGAVGLVMGVLGIFGSSLIPSLSPWALAILGLIFFTAGISMLKYRKDSEVIDAESSHNK